MNAVTAMMSRPWHDCIDSVALTVANWRDRLSPPRTVRLVQDNDNEFVLETTGNVSSSPSDNRFRMENDQARNNLPADLAATISGSRVELILRPDLFLFRPIELPSRAGEFLSGIVKAQIDRLTPWTATAAAYGWSKPTESNADRMIVTVAATALSLLKPYTDAITRLGAHSVTIMTPAPDAVTPIQVLDLRARGATEIGRIRKLLVMILAACGITTAATLAAAAIINATLESQHAQLAEKQTRLRANVGTAGRALEQRRHQSPAAVMVLEALSDLLPDHTYVTELRIEGNKVRVIGVTRDAPSLIELIERSGRFTRASFFAPTTRSTSETNERFHIEAIIQPIYSLRS